MHQLWANALKERGVVPSWPLCRTWEEERSSPALIAETALSLHAFYCSSALLKCVLWHRDICDLGKRTRLYWKLFASLPCCHSGAWDNFWATAALCPLKGNEIAQLGQIGEKSCWLLGISYLQRFFFFSHNCLLCLLLCLLEACGHPSQLLMFAVLHNIKTVTYRTVVKL